MIVIFTQDMKLVNISDFKSIDYFKCENDDEHYIIGVNNEFVLGVYSITEAPQIMAYIGSTIGKYKADDNLCITMPMAKRGNENAENGGENSSQEVVGKVPTEE